MLHPVTDRVLIHRSDFCASNTTVVLGPAGTVLLVDPGVSRVELDQLAALLRRSRLTVVAGVSTHPHWDHLLWHRDWGAVCRYAAGAAGELVGRTHGELVRQAEQAVPGSGRRLWPGLTSLTEPDAPTGTQMLLAWDGPPVRILEHRAHAPGHLALLVETEGVLLAGDMLSDSEIPLLDLDAADPVGDYLRALRLMEDLPGVRSVIPGHGSVGDAGQLRRRIAADRTYLRGLGDAAEVTDPRLGPPAADWMVREHHAQRALARGEMR